MDYIQILVLVAVLLMVAKLLISSRRKEISSRRLGLWIFFLIIIVVLVFYPGLSDRAALFLGIDRGTDAAFFAAILLIFYLLFKIFMRLEQMESGITKVVRELALRESEDDSRKP